MDAKNHYKILNRNWYPRFKNAATEREFMLDFNASALNSGRLGVLIILIIWIGFALFDLRMDDDAGSRALIFRLLIITPIFLGVLAMLYSKHATAIYQILAIFSLLVIQGSIYYVFRLDKAQH